MNSSSLLEPSAVSPSFHLQCLSISQTETLVIYSVLSLIALSVYVLPS